MSRPRILLTRRWPEEVEGHLQQSYDVTRRVDDSPMSMDELQAAMCDYDALCPTVTDQIGRSVIEVSARRVQLIANYGVGYNHIDVQTCRNRGIAVSNTPDVLTAATADLALTLMLMASRRAGEGERLLRSGAWTGWAPTQLLGCDLSGKRVGLIGLGRIAQAVALRASRGFDMEITYSSPRRAPAETERAVGALYVEQLDDLLAGADIVSIHCPGGSATHHLIDRRRLQLMKDTAILINTARGTVVDEVALAEALAERRIAAAGLDVYEREPAVHPGLLNLENAVLLPHLGSATRETRVAMGMRVATNLDAWFAGQNPPDRVA